MSKIPLIVVVGPTASGKTALAIDIANYVGGEIVSADSMQIYKYMDIGSAKPTAEEMSQAVHHLIGFLEPDDEFSVADYTELAHKTIADITSRGKIAVMAGGTGLYINSVVNDVTFGEIDTDYELREKLQKTAEEKGSEYLLDMLAEFDKESAERLHPNNVRRIIRAIEFYKTTGKPISKHQEETKRVESRYNPLMICIDWDRDVLFDTAIAILAGLMIVPAVFAFSGGDQSALGKGPSLMFVTLPKVFESMGMATVIGSVFFILVLLAALTSSISIMETIVSSRVKYI